MHPANIGHDLTRIGAPSGDKLSLYLSRALKLPMFNGDFKNVMRDLRTVYATGAKLVVGSCSPREAGEWDEQRLELAKWYIELAHSVDPELIFDAYIGSYIGEGASYIEVPEQVLSAFGLPCEKRRFDFSRQNEDKLWYFFRARQFLDAGFESLSFDRCIPREIRAMFDGGLALVFMGEPDAAELSVESEEAICSRWTEEKQRER